MNLHFESIITTKGKEVRVNGDIFKIEMEGYVFYEMEELLKVRKSSESQAFGNAKIVETNWKNNKTTIYFQLVSLKTVN
jgi:hypothetical protein